MDRGVRASERASERKRGICHRRGGREGRTSQKRNITPGTHKGSAAYSETDDGRISLSLSLSLSWGLTKKLCRGVLDDPSPSTGHAPDRSRYFIRSCELFSKQATDDGRMGNGPP